MARRYASQARRIKAKRGETRSTFGTVEGEAVTGRSEGASYLHAAGLLERDKIPEMPIPDDEEQSRQRRRQRARRRGRGGRSASILSEDTLG